MVEFRKMIGTEGEFSTVLKNKLQKFRLELDYNFFYEIYGNLRREHYVILSENLVDSLREVD